jgi:CRISPR-associated endonuclease/helicase Cas3
MLGGTPRCDLHDPSTYTEYFRRLYHAVPLDAKGIDSDRKELRFATVGQKYRVIDEPTVAVAVPWREAEKLLDEVEARSGDIDRDDLRALHPYFVSLRAWEHRQAQQANLCREIAPGLWRWEGRYDEDLGLLLEAGELPFLYSPS